MWINPVAPGADHVSDEDAVVFSMTEHLQQTAVATEDVAPRDLPRAGHTCFEWNLTYLSPRARARTIEISGME